MGGGIHVLVAEGFESSRCGGGRAAGYVNAPSNRSVCGAEESNTCSAVPQCHHITHRECHRRERPRQREVRVEESII